MSWQRNLSNLQRKMKEADGWLALRNRFVELAREEERIELEAGQANLPDGFGDSALLVWKNGEVFLYRSGVARKSPSQFEGAVEKLEARFRILATQAGKALGNCPEELSAADYWVQELVAYLLEDNSDQILSVNQGGLIGRPSLASAALCERREKKALAETNQDFAALDPKRFANRPVLPTIKRRVQKTDVGPAPIAVGLRPPPGQITQAAPAQSKIGHNIDKYRKECGWSVDMLASKTGIDKNAILDHINKNAKPRPKTLKEYADAFSRCLGERVKVSDLEQ